MASRVALRAAVRPAVLRPVVARTAVARTYSSSSRSGRSSSSSSSSSSRRSQRGAWAVAAAVAVGAGLASGVALSEAKQAPAPVSSAAANNVDFPALRKAIVDILDADDYDDGSYGPLLVRLAWHSSGTYCKETKTGGSDGATMRHAGEANWGANAGLNIARDLLEPIKKKFPGISYADLWILAGNVAIEEMGGPHLPFRSGRRDVGPEVVLPDGRLPDATKAQDHIRQIFYRMGFNDQEIVALLGAHALGRCHEDRSGFKGPWTRSPTTFSNEFFRVLLEEQWTDNKTYSKAKQFMDKSGDLMMTPADLALTGDPEFKKWVVAYAKDEKLFFRDFAAAWTKLTELGCRNLSALEVFPEAGSTPVSNVPKPAAGLVPAAPAALPPAVAAAAAGKGPAPGVPPPAVTNEKPAAGITPQAAAHLAATVPGAADKLAAKGIATPAAPAPAAKKEEQSWWKKIFG